MVIELALLLDDWTHRRQRIPGYIRKQFICQCAKQTLQDMKVTCLKGVGEKDNERNSMGCSQLVAAEIRLHEYPVQKRCRTGNDGGI